MEYRTRSRIVINQGFKPINPMQCGDEVCLSRHSFGPATRDHYLLHFVVSGKGEYVTPRGRYTVVEDQIFVIKPHEITYYEADEKDPWSYIWLGFTSDMPLPAELTSSDVITAPELRKLFLEASDNSRFEDGNIGGAYECYLCGIIWQLIGILKSRGQSVARIGESYVSPAISIIRSEYQNALTVDGIASRLHVNRCYFSEVFKTVTGVSPKKYLDDFRMEKAAELLTKRGVNVSVTAISVGFSDVFAFSRAFKRHYGISPSKYVEKYKIQP